MLAKELTIMTKWIWINLRELAFRVTMLLNLKRQGFNLMAFTRSELATYLKFWYHDFGAFGFSTPQFLDKSYKLHQEAKDIFLLPYIKNGIILAKEKFGNNLQLAELFAADSYFGIYSLLQDRNLEVISIDLLGDSGEGSKRSPCKEQALLAAKYLGVDSRLSYRVESVFEFNSKVQVVVNVGGMYHIEQPRELLTHLRQICEGFMILQTVVNENPELDSYFESPAPNWNWGSRFSLKYLKSIIDSTGWEILEEDFNILNGNIIPADRGSAYFLLKAK